MFQGMAKSIANEFPSAKQFLEQVGLDGAVFDVLKIGRRSTRIQAVRSHVRRTDRNLLLPSQDCAGQAHSNGNCSTCDCRALPRGVERVTGSFMSAQSLILQHGVGVNARSFCSRTLGHSVGEYSGAE